jgi:type IV pilus assembly protein PilV
MVLSKVVSVAKDRSWRRASRSHSGATGATLVEALITLLVLSIGLLGMAALQLTSMRENAGALHHSQAIWLAYEMADRMRANLDHRPSTPPHDRSDHYDGISVTGSEAADSCGAGAACTFEQMADFDAAEWGKAIAGLPGGEGSVQEIDDTGRFVIRVMWDEAAFSWRREGRPYNPVGCPRDPAIQKTCVEIIVWP